MAKFAGGFMDGQEHEVILEGNGPWFIRLLSEDDPKDGFGTVYKSIDGNEFVVTEDVFGRRTSIS